jgi:multidrug efflux pump subunit AcrB
MNTIRFTSGSERNTSARGFQTAGDRQDYDHLHAAVPQVFVHVGRDKVLKQGVELSHVYKTLQTFMGGLFYRNSMLRQFRQNHFQGCIAAETY